MAAKQNLSVRLELKGGRVCGSRRVLGHVRTPAAPNSPDPALPSRSTPGEVGGNLQGSENEGFEVLGVPLMLGRGCDGKATSAEGHIAMAMGRGRVEKVLTLISVPLAEKRDTKQPQRGPRCR